MPATVASVDLMDRIYRHQRHIYDITRKHYLLGRDRLIDQLAPAAAAGVLELGCGTGRNLIRAAQRYPGRTFFGIDVSTEMLTSAREAIAQAGLSARVSLAHADVMALDTRALFARPNFERVFISYSLSMMPDWQAVLDIALDLVALGGQLHIVDFGRQEKLPAWFRTGLRQWLGLFHVTPRDDLEPVLTTCVALRNATLRVERPYRGYAQYVRVRLPG
ncbi:MAG: class I SAM-dependent methyltransferase [Xanthobacteraceae bacterium]